MKRVSGVQANFHVRGPTNFKDLTKRKVIQQERHLGFALKTGCGFFRPQGQVQWREGPDSAGGSGGMYQSPAHHLL